jgi:hypothetical protein
MRLHAESNQCRPRLSAKTVGTRVCFRIGHKWPGAEGHVLAYFANCVDRESGMVEVWDLTAETQFSAPLTTTSGPWTKRPTTDQRADAADELKGLIGARVEVLGNLV